MERANRKIAIALDRCHENVITKNLGFPDPDDGDVVSVAHVLWLCPEGSVDLETALVCYAKPIAI